MFIIISEQKVALYKIVHEMTICSERNIHTEISKQTSEAV